MTTTDTGISLLTCEFRRLGGWNIRNLAAPYWRLYWNQESGCHVRDTHGTHALLPHALVLIPPDTDCSGSSNAVFHQLYIHFAMEPRYLPTPRAIIRLMTPGSKIEEAQACRDAIRDEPQDSLRLGFLAQALVHWSLAQLPSGALSTSSTDRRIDRSIAMLREALPRSVANDRLAASQGMNTNAFIRLFRETTGETPQAYYTRLRIEHACRLLHFSNSSIDVIAEAAGFCDRYHFSRVFKRLRGTGPARFRRLRDAM